MKYVKTLIDKAGENAGSFYKLSAVTGLAESTISQIRSGKRNLPLDVVPLIADIAGVEVDEAIHQVMVEQERDPQRRSKLVEILGKAVAAGVAGVLVFSYNGGSTSDTQISTSSASDLRMYTSWKIWLKIFAGIFTRAGAAA